MKYNCNAHHQHPDQIEIDQSENAVRFQIFCLSVPETRHTHYVFLESLHLFYIEYQYRYMDEL